MQLKYIVIILSLFISFSAHAQKSKWELGGGIGTLDFRLYPGSKQSNYYIVPLPYMTYSNKYVQIDRGIRGILTSSERWKLDISADFGLPVNSSNSDVRQGMENLDPVIQFGPSLEYTFTGDYKSKDEVRLEVPLRSAIIANSDNVHNVGWLIEPRLVYEQRRIGKSGLFYKLRTGLRYASKDQHAYYYDVDQTFVTPDRELFQSDEGYSGFLLDLRATWREDNMLFWGIARYQSLSGAAFEDSPLVEDENYFLIGMGVTWIFMSSD